MSVTLKVGAKSATLEAATAKKSLNTYWALGGAVGSRFGVKVPAFDKALPTEVELAGTKVTLTHKRRERDNKRTATAAGISVTVDGQEKSGKVVITDHGDGTWQVTAAIFGKGAGGGGQVRDDLFA